MKNRRYVVAITGASGVIYGLRLCREIIRCQADLTVLISTAGHQVLQEECGLQWQGSEAAVAQLLRDHLQARKQQLSYYEADNFRAPIASGSNAPDAMVVCPCSMGTLSRIAAGNSGNLLERCADVMLKERRTLVLVPRETPLNVIHLENMLKLARMGVTMVPPMPAFYHRPQTIDDLIGFVVGKVLDVLGLEHALYRRWRQGDTTIPEG